MFIIANLTTKSCIFKTDRRRVTIASEFEVSTCGHSVLLYYWKCLEKGTGMVHFIGMLNLNSILRFSLLVHILPVITMLNSAF